MFGVKTRPSTKPDAGVNDWGCLPPTPRVLSPHVCVRYFRSAYTSSDSLPTNRACDADVSERRTRLLVELETLRRRVHDAEGRLRSVDCSLPGRRYIDRSRP